MSQVALQRPLNSGGRGRWRDAAALLGPLIALLFVWLLFAALAGERFIRWENTQLMLLQTAVIGVAALGATMIIISGGIDLSVGSTIALVTVVVAICLERGLSPVPAVCLAIGTGVTVGLLMGGMITALRLSPFIVTLGLWGALRGAAKGIAGNQPVYPADLAWLPALMQQPPRGSFMLVAPGVWILLLLAIITAALLRYTRFGRHIFAIGSNEATARLCGIRINRSKLGIYTLAAALAGVAGVLQFAFLTIGDPTTAQGYELRVIAAVVIGGASLSGGLGSVLGTLVGAMIMTMVDNGCTKLELPNWVQEIVTGVIIITAVAVDRLRHRAAA